MLGVERPNPQWRLVDDNTAGKSLPSRFASGMPIGQHGSWDRSTPSGYKVNFILFANGMPSGDPEDVLTGFLDANGSARGRPVGVAIGGDGELWTCLWTEREMCQKVLVYQMVMAGRDR
ncbi:hypothetical protein HYPGJ_30442 [Hyphomicrobium sp. GJ21]|nr:hypothetical protein [Hyphomicrobium sp. GJ21]CEJ86402.1 hypothetical protein HYPGJ_30442 [Hyphomicrobium sp. GJ21]